MDKTSKIVLLIMVAAFALGGTARAQDVTFKEGKVENAKERMEEHWKAMDSSGDGAIDKAEFLKDAEARFEKIDANHDGKITQDERDAMRQNIREKMQKLRAVMKRRDMAQ